MHSSSEEHVNAVYRILWYLKCALERGILFSKNNISDIKGYTDTDWAGDQITGKSMLGYITIVEGNLFTCKS